MNLAEKVRKKNDHLLVQRILLQQHICARAQTAEMGPYLLTFVAAPLVVGMAAHSLLRWRGMLPRSLQSAVLPSLRFIPFI